MLARGSPLGRYRIEALLGRGGAGDVYRAYDPVLDRQVALKTVRLDRGTSPAEEAGAVAEARILREARAAAKLVHPSVVSIYEVGSADGVPFIAMELVDGPSLRQRLPATGVPLPTRLGWLKDIASALATAHARGLVHRDVKPENVMVAPDGTAKVLDFGIARHNPALDEGAASSSSSRMSARGTPRYMAPEQFTTAVVDPRTDEYAWGVLAYEVLTGQHPADAAGLPPVCPAAMVTSFPSVRSLDPDVSPELSDLVATTLDHDPDRRFATMDPIVDALLLALRQGVPLAERSPAAARLAPKSADTREDPEAATASLPFTPTPPPRLSTAVATPLHRRRGPLLAAAALLALTAAVAVSRLASRGERRPAPAVNREAPADAAPTVASARAGPASPPLTKVFVLGFANRTKEEIFEGTLDLVLDRALYRSATLDPLSVTDLVTLAGEGGSASLADEDLARRLATRTRERMLTVSGEVTSHGGGYTLSVDTKDAGTGSALLHATLEAADASRVVPTVGLLASRIRAAVGEAAPLDGPLAEKTGMSTSVEADHEYLRAQTLSNDGYFSEGIAHSHRALEIDPGFVMARVGLGLALWGASSRDEAYDELKVAFQGVDAMGDRERLKFLCDYYATFGEYESAVPECKRLLERWPGDVKTEINLSVTYAQAGDTTSALRLGRTVMEERPRNELARVNVMNFCLIAGDLACTVAEGRRAEADFSNVPAALMSNLGAAEELLGDRAAAKQAFEEVRAVEPWLAKYGALDLAFAEGRLDDAARMSEAFARAADADHRDIDAATGWATVARVRLRRGERALARTAAARALGKQGEARIVFLAASVCLETGCEPQALSAAAAFDKSLSVDERVFGRLLRAEALRLHGKARDAAARYEEVLREHDSWFGHLGLARAYLDLRAFPEAYGELRKCHAKRGEAANYWLPTTSLVTPVTYLLGLAQEGFGSPEAKATFQTFLSMEPEEQNDPLAAEARKKLGVR